MSIGPQSDKPKELAPLYAYIYVCIAMSSFQTE